MEGKYSALDIARYIINYSIDIGKPVSNLKLQKLLYFVQGNFLRILKKPCFYENIEAWKYGPVVPNVYSEFKMYGSNDIPKILNYNYFEKNKYRSIKKKFLFNLPENEKEIVNGVVIACADFSSSYLVTLTHNQSPWKNSFHGYPTIITLKEMRDYFCD